MFGIHTIVHVQRNVSPCTGHFTGNAKYQSSAKCFGSLSVLETCGSRNQPHLYNYCCAELSCTRLRGDTREEACCSPLCPVGHVQPYTRTRDPELPASITTPNCIGVSLPLWPPPPAVGAAEAGAPSNAVIQTTMPSQATRVGIVRGVHRRVRREPRLLVMHMCGRQKGIPFTVICVEQAICHFRRIVIRTRVETPRAKYRAVLLHAQCRLVCSHEFQTSISQRYGGKVSMWLAVSASTSNSSG